MNGMPAAEEGSQTPALPETGIPVSLVKNAQPKRGQDDPVEREAQAALRAADSKLRSGDAGGAVRDASRSIDLHAENPRALGIRAEGYNLLRNYAAAEADALASIKLFPRNAAALRNLAWARLKQRNWKEAADAAKRAVAENPKNGFGHALRAYSEAAAGNRATALEALKRAAELDAAYRKRYDAAAAGGSIYDPNEADSSLTDLVTGAASKRPPWALILLGIGIATTLGGVGWALLPLLKRSGKESSDRIRLTPAPWIDDAPAASDAPTERLAGRYEIVRTIGRGGMGVVYEAKDHTLHRIVAVKRMNYSLADLGEEGKRACLKEARMVASMHHASIVDIYDVIDQNNQLYLVFELVQGKTVQALLAEKGRLSLAETAEILRPVCKALEFAHGKNLVHRDLKPANIMVSQDREVKLMDFGIARVVTTRGANPATKTQTIVGTPAYMAPESVQGVVRKEGDLYALGMTLYEMLTGELPFPGDNSIDGKVNMRYARPSAKVAGLPPEIDDLVAAALQPSPATRIHSAKDFLARLKQAAKAPSDTPA
ncbi:MAG: serine/threonine protein kinase [Proteobacteria bacterium]|nr:serine/threonine protein kinase [Pseudomonadota bacterium]